MRSLLTPRWLLAHLVTVAAAVTCLALGWWQIGRAASGNPLSYGYAVEWPVFAAFVVAVWLGEARKAVRAARAGSVPEPASAPAHTPGNRHDGPAYDDSGDDQLAAYNRYLAWLNANPHASPAQYPG